MDNQMKLYVTNIVTSWNEVKNRQTINLYGRTDDGTAEVIEVHGFSDIFTPMLLRSKKTSKHY